MYLVLPNLPPLLMWTPCETVQLLPASVSAIQAPERAPFPTQTVEAVELAKRDASMDMPFLLRFAPRRD